MESRSLMIRPEQHAQHDKGGAMASTGGVGIVLIEVRASAAARFADGARRAQC